MAYVEVCAIRFILGRPDMPTSTLGRSRYPLPVCSKASCSNSLGLTDGPSSRQGVGHLVRPGASRSAPTKAVLRKFLGWVRESSAPQDFT